MNRAERNQNVLLLGERCSFGSFRPFSCCFFFCLSEYCGFFFYSSFYSSSDHVNSLRMLALKREGSNRTPVSFRERGLARELRKLTSYEAS